MNYIPASSNSVVAGTCIGILFASAALYFLGSIIYWRRREMKEQRELHDRNEEAIKKMLADGKIRRPRGQMVIRNWARKWIAYSNSLPVTCKRYEMKGNELPRYPMDEK